MNRMSRCQLLWLLLKGWTHLFKWKVSCHPGKGWSLRMRSLACHLHRELETKTTTTQLKLLGTKSICKQELHTGFLQRGCGDDLPAGDGSSFCSGTNWNNTSKKGNQRAMPPVLVEIQNPWAYEESFWNISDSIMPSDSCSNSGYTVSNWKGRIYYCLNPKCGIS